MDICYNKLFKMLIDKGMKKTEFRKQVGISEGTLAKLSRNENVSMDVIVKICRKMNMKANIKRISQKKLTCILTTVFAARRASRGRGKK